LLGDFLPKFCVKLCQVHGFPLKPDQVLTELSVSLHTAIILKTLTDFIQKPVNQVILKKADFLPHDFRNDKSPLYTVIQPVELNVTFQQQQRVRFLVVRHTAIDYLKENLVNQLVFLVIMLL